MVEQFSAKALNFEAPRSEWCSKQLHDQSLCYIDLLIQLETFCTHVPLYFCVLSVVLFQVYLTLQ